MQKQVDVAGRDSQEGKGWFYSEIVKDHFFNPRNLLKSDSEVAAFNPDGVGLVGSPACGDMMKMWIQVDKASDKIVACGWRTFGCASAIASTSMLSVMVSENGGMPIDQAMRLRPQDIAARLGSLPSRKIHCSVLGHKALRAAINDYFRRSGQPSRIMAEGARVIDKALKITDRDIEEAVLDGAKSLEEVQAITKVGVHDKSCLPEVEELVRFYREKHYGKDA